MRMKKEEKMKVGFLIKLLVCSLSDNGNRWKREIWGGEGR